VKSATKQIGVVVGEDYQELEFWYPVLRFREMGAAVTVIGAEAEHTYRSRLGYPVLPDRGLAEVTPAEFDAIILPGGAAPASGAEARLAEFLRAARRGGAVLAALSTGANLLDAAGLGNGDRGGVAGQTAAVVVEGRCVTARSVDDLPAFFKAVLAALDTAPVKSAASA
jgi:protease I